jgi:hypothetical protein
MGPSLGLSVLCWFAGKTGEPTHERLQLGGRKMNPYKIRAIIDHVRSHGGLPTDQFSNILEPDEVLAWFGLNQLLCPEEQRVVRTEIRLLAEAQLLAGQLKLGS